MTTLRLSQLLLRLSTKNTSSKTPTPTAVHTMLDPNLHTNARPPGYLHPPSPRHRITPPDRAIRDGLR